MNSIKINYDKEELEIDGEKITKPFIVKVPYIDGYQKAKVFNHKNGWEAGEKLPCISISKLANSSIDEVLNSKRIENREEKIKEIFFQRMKGFAASMEELSQIIDVINVLSDKGISVHKAQAILSDAARIISEVTEC